MEAILSDQTAVVADETGEESKVPTLKLDSTSGSDSACGHPIVRLVIGRRSIGRGLLRQPNGKCPPPLLST